MTKQIRVRLLSMLFLLSTPAFSQPNYNLEIYSGYSFNISNNLLENWGDGLGLGLGVSYNASNRIQLATGFLYQHLSYQGGNVEIMVPAFPGYRPVIDGEATNIYELTILARIRGERRTVSPFLTLGGGIQVVDTGRILIDRAYTYGESGKVTQEATGALGIGLSAALRSTMNLMIKIRVTGTSNRESGFLALVSSVQFAL